ncbi:MAG: hypothetical protein WC375_01485, partial [Methanomassiliicoccales archaeon]
MSFRNVNTHYNMVRDGQEKLFHIRYDSEVGILEKELSSGVKDHPLIIDGQRLQARSTFEDRSPIDASIVVGRFPRARSEDVDSAV